MTSQHPDLFGWCETCETNQDKVTIYTLKPKNQIPDLYAIIEYKNYQNEKEVKNESEKSEGEDQKGEK